MPTENRSSNTEMVSVPRSMAKTLCKPDNHRFEWDVEDAKNQLRALLSRPAPQPHTEPIAWMVGTAFWWTKEEAERDAAETGLAVTPVGPITGKPAEQNQGDQVSLPARKPEPTEESDVFTDAENSGFNECLDEIAKLGPLYTHADPGEVEPATECFCIEHGLHIETLRAQLAERDALLHEVSISPDWSLSVDLQVRISDALSASAEPSAPKCCTPTAEEEALLASGDFRPEELWGGSRPTCQKCINAEPSDECAHSYANKLGCPECGEAFSGAEQSAPIAWHVGGNGYDRICFEMPADLPGHPCIQPIHDQRQLIELLKRYDLRDEDVPPDERAHGIPGTSFQRLNALANQGE